MRLHLPNLLRKALLALLASAAYPTTVDAACLHSAVSPTTYTDFGQNMGRYSVYQVNALLTSIIERDGVQIPYTTGAQPGTLDNRMISFEGMNNDGAFTAVGYNYTATVSHNGCPNPCFTSRYIDDSQAIHYQGVEYRSSTGKVFLLSPSIDYKITRSSKIFTDITASGVFDVTQYLRDGGEVTSLVHYRAGAGTCDQADFEGNTHNLAGGYAYITGGVVATQNFSYQGTSDSYPIAYDYTRDYGPNEGPRDSRGIIDDPYTITVRGIQDYGPGGAGQPSADNPKVYLLPFVSRGGDSGSPVWAWNEKSQEYELISCHQARGGDTSYSRGASEWTMATMEYFNEHVDMETAGHTVHIGAVHRTEKSKYIYDETNKVGTTPQYGSITSDAADFQAVSFCGVGADLESGETIYTWLSLNPLKDNQKWYSYGNDYFNANGNGSDKQMTLGDLFYTENIVFESNGSAENTIYLDADIDTGIGYVQFSPKEAGQHAVFHLESNGKAQDGRDYMLNSAGYVVDAGAELHIHVTNTQKDDAGNYYYREWRKQGAGDMYLEGLGNNEIFLNLGGKGTTHLNEQDGYAAYNVLINNGATVNLNGDASQIARDVTFGNGGGYLDFHGLESFNWESGANGNVDAEGFTINALTQDATLINTTGNTTLHYTTGDATSFLGSFKDTDTSSLTVIYEGGGTWTLNSIHTMLANEGSGFIVQSGTVELVGTNTMHAIGSDGGKAGSRYFDPNDWHYADSTMEVTVKDQATFRLGSHARLIGDVKVEDGGTLEIAEGVKHRYEYIEGWLVAEDTYQDDYRKFYGLKGGVTLEGSSTLRFHFSEGTDAENVYGYNITGSGSVDMQLGGSGATLVLSGNNDFTGAKQLAGGGLIAASPQALGNTETEKWHVDETAFIAVKGLDGNDALAYIAGDSKGVLALTQDQMEAVKLTETGHKNMIVGALAGEVVQYGEAPTTVGSRTVYTDAVLKPVTLSGEQYWQLGGGGGELVVNFMLDNPDGHLVLGNEYTTGTVTLTNVWNRIGTIDFAGKVTLNYTSEEALGGSKISLDYTNRVAGSPTILKLITRHSSGAMMLDGMEDADVDLTEHTQLYLGAEGTVDYTGTITPGGDTYRFGGITGTLALHRALEDYGGKRTDLIVDAQTYSGGALVLAEKAGITGDVTVMGCDIAHPNFSGGDITLRLGVEDAIATAASVTLKNGAVLDVNGKDQKLNRFNMDAGSLLTDSSEDWNSTVTLNVAADETSALRGGVDVRNLIKDGDGTLLLAGDNAYGTLIINKGLVDLQNGNSMSANGITMVEDNGVLNMSGDFDVTGTVAFSGGKALVGGKSINGTIMVGTSEGGEAETGTLEQVGTNVSTKINSSIEISEPSTLVLKGSGSYVLSALDINESGGIIDLQASRLSFNRGGSDPVNVGGTVRITGGDTAAARRTLFSSGSSNNMTRNINHLDINGGYAGIAEESWNTVWNIHSLTGNGDFLWNSSTTHWYSARIVLDGENTFDGKFTAQRTGGDSGNRRYQAYVELAHDRAAQNMDMDIQGRNTNNYMSLAVNTENATVRSLSGNTHSVLYAGAARVGEENDKGTPLATAPVSTRNATLTITGNKDATFSGVVAGGESTEEVDNPGLSIVMNGTGSQTFNGSSATFNNVTVNSGKLAIAATNTTVRGDITLATGSELSMESWTLADGHSLSVYGDAAKGAAKFTADLTMDGGSIDYSAHSLNAGSTPALQLTSVTGGDQAVTINFSDTSALQVNTNYYLANGDWHNIAITEASRDLGYMTATFNNSSNGLYVSFSMVEGSIIWNGNYQSHKWDETHFGQAGSVPGSTGAAVFTDSALNPDVDISSSSTVAAVMIDSSRDYLFHSANGSKVTAGELVKSGSGKAELTEAVVIGTAVKKGSVEINGGELVAKSADTLANINSIQGEGTLGISYSGAQESAIFHNESDYVGALHIAGGSYTSGADWHYDELLLGKDSTYTLGGNKLLMGNVEVNGANAGIDLSNRTLAAVGVNLASDLNLRGNGGTLAAAVNGEGHAVHADGTLTIAGASFNADLDVAGSATVKLSGGAYNHIGDISLGSGATLQMEYGTGITNGAAISMGEGARLQMVNGAGDCTQVYANIVMEGSSATITGSSNGNGSYMEGTVSGSGTLYLAQEGGHKNAWRMDSVISDAAEGGPLALDINSSVTLTAANAYTGGTTISGADVQVNNENALAGGSLNITGGTLKLNSNLNLTSLSGTGGTIQLNGKTLVLTGNDTVTLPTFGGSLSGSGSIHKTGAGLQSFSRAAALTNVTVEGGNLQLSGGSVSGKIAVADGAGLYVKENDLTISSAIENAGLFFFSTTSTPKLILDPSGNFEQVSQGYRDINGGTDSGNGFALGTDIKVFNNSGNAQIQNVATVEYLGDTLQLNAETGIASMGASTSVYSVRKGIVTYDSDFTSHAEAAGIRTFNLISETSAEPATLQLAQNLVNDTTILSAGNGGNVDIGAGLTLRQDQLNAQARTTLLGSGTYALNQGQAALPTSVYLGDADEWTGTVRVSNVSFKGTDISGLANAKSFVELNGIKDGYVKQWQGVLGTNIRLTDTASGSPAWKWTDGQSTGASTITFTGQWVGDGTFAMGGSGKNQNFTFSGDVSGWTGKYVQLGNSSTVTFAGVGNLQEIGADIVCEDGTLNLVAGNGSSATNATFNGNLRDVTTLLINAGSTATLAGNDNSLKTVTVQEGASLVNTGYTYLGGDVVNNGTITNSGVLDYGWNIGVANVTNLQSGNIIINTLLESGCIVNSGIITISGWMDGVEEGYEDANGKTGHANPNNNGFATTTLDVLGTDGLIDNRAGGKIMFGGQDVTEQVLKNHKITSVVNYGTYYINKTDNDVTFSKIYNKSKGAVDTIMFEAGTALNVDDAQAAHLRTSQVYYFGETGPTLNMAPGATLIIDESVAATVAAASGSAVTLQLAAGSPGEHLTLDGFSLTGATVDITGSGVLELGKRICDVSTLNIRGGAVYSNYHNEGTGFSGHNTVNVYGGGMLQLATSDNLGWGGACTKSIVLAGEEGNPAVMELGARQTFSTSLAMNGHAVVRVMSVTTGTGENAPMLDPFGGGSISVSGKNNLLAVPIRMRSDMTVTVAKDGELDFSGGVYGQGDTHNKTLTKAGEGKMVLTGNSHQYTRSTVNLVGGTLEVQTDAAFSTLASSGTLNIASGTTGITTYTASNTGATVSVGAGARLNIGGASTLGSVIDNSGTVAFTAEGSTITLRPDGDYDKRGEGYLDVATGKFSTTGNGIRSQGSVLVVNGGVTEAADNVSVSYNGGTYTLRNDGRAYGQEDTANYYVHTGSADYTAAVAAVASLSNVVLSGGAVLNMQTALADDVSISSSGGTVNIGEGVTLSRDSLAATEATKLGGSGTYALQLENATTLGDHVSLDASWRGTVSLSGMADGQVSLDNLSRRSDGSFATLEMAGATADLQPGVINADLQLADVDEWQPALMITNAGDFTFKGDISGSGSIINYAEEMSNYIFNGGDLSEWSGMLCNYGTLNVVISGMENGSSLGAELVDVDGVSYIAEKAGDTYTVAAVDTDFTGTTLAGNNGGTLEVTELGGIGDLTVNGSVRLSGGECEGALVTVSQDATLYLNGVQASQAELANNGTVILESEQSSVAGVSGSGLLKGAGNSLHALEMQGEGTYTSSASIEGAVDLVKSGSGIQTFSGDLSKFTGAVEVSDGKLVITPEVNIVSLTMKGGEIELGANATLGNVRVASGADAVIDAHGTTITLGHAILNSGSLTLLGNIDANQLAMQSRANSYVDAKGKVTADGSGFATVENAVEVVRNVVAGELVGAQNIQVTHGGETVTLSSDGWARFASGEHTNYTAYYVRDNDIDGLTLAQIQAAVQEGATLDRVVFDNPDLPLNLVVDSAADMSLFLVNEDSTSNIILAETGTVASAAGYKGVEGLLKLSGSGTYSLTDSATLGNGVSLDADNWHGTVAMGGTANTLDLSSAGGLWTRTQGGEASTVRFDGWSSALSDTGWETDANIEIGAGGLTVQGEALSASAAPDYVFNGALSGTGDITNNRIGAAKFHLNGDISAWEGDFVNGSGTAELHPSLYLEGSGDVTLKGNIVQLNNGALDVYLGGTDTQSVTIDGNVGGEGGTIKLNAKADTAFNGTVNAAGGLVIDDGMTVTFRNNASVANLSGTGKLEVNGTDAVVTLDTMNGYSGSILLTQGSVETTGTVDLSNSTFTQTGGALAVSDDQSLVLGYASIISAIENGGSVEFTQDITASGLLKSSEIYLVGADDERSYNDNYFDGARSSTVLYVVNGGTVTANGHKVTQDNVEYALQKDGTAVTAVEDSIDFSTFIQHEAGSTLDASLITDTARGHGEYLVGVDVENATLNVDASLYWVYARDAQIVNDIDPENILILELAGGINTLTGSASMLGTTMFLDEAAVLHMQNADGSTYHVQAGGVDFYGAKTNSRVTVSTAAAQGEEGYDFYSLDSGRFTVESRETVKVENGDITVGNHIKTEVVSTGETTGNLTLANGADAESLDEVVAELGGVTFLNMAAENKTPAGNQTSITLSKLKIGAGQTVSFYETAAPAPEVSGNLEALARESSVTIANTLSAGKGARLNADLVMEEGSLLDVSEAQESFGLSLGCTLTLTPGAQLSEAVVTGLAGLTDEKPWYFLYTDVEQLEIPEYGSWDATAGEMLAPGQLDAAMVYRQLETGRYSLVYNWGQNVGTYTVALYLIPEPATSTLGLLALAALAARRRRK